MSSSRRSPPPLRHARLRYPVSVCVLSLVSSLQLVLKLCPSKTWTFRHELAVCRFESCPLRGAHHAARAMHADQNAATSSSRPHAHMTMNSRFPAREPLYHRGRGNAHVADKDAARPSRRALRSPHAARWPLFHWPLSGRSSPPPCFPQTRQTHCSEGGPFPSSFLFFRISPPSLDGFSSRFLSSPAPVTRFPPLSPSCSSRLSPWP